MDNLSVDLLVLEHGDLPAMATFSRRTSDLAILLSSGAVRRKLGMRSTLSIAALRTDVLDAAGFGSLGDFPFEACFAGRTCLADTRVDPYIDVVQGLVRD